jgi:hypothetical protein
MTWTQTTMSIRRLGSRFRKPSVVFGNQLFQHSVHAGAEVEESCSLGSGPLSVENGLHHLEDVAFTPAHLHTA